MAIADRKVKAEKVADSTDPEPSFAEIDARQLRRATNDPGVKKLHAAADRHLERLQAEGRIRL